MKINVLTNKIGILVHILFWGGYLFLSVFVFSGREDLEQAILISVIQIFPQMVIAYINMEVLIPKFLITKRYTSYIGFVLVCFLGLHLFYEFALPVLFEYLGQPPRGARRWIREHPGFEKRRFLNPMRRLRMLYFFTQTLAIYLLSTAFKTSQIALKREKEAADLKSENLNAELKFLRSQINPHFLFNALNNIYSLSIIKSEKTPEHILKLSNMLRYIIYDCNADRVSLEKELNYINNYVDLQKLKDDQITNIETDFERADPKCMIAPMVLIPFIENSFKHSKIEDITRGWIKIKIENIGDKLVFSVSNSVPKEGFSKDSVGGVGLENVKRRLELLYPNSHRLTIEHTNSKYSVELEINLKP